MGVLALLVAAVVQGLTEFLPISSSGHLRLAQHAFGLREPATAIDLALHLATLLSVLVVFRKDLLRMANLRRPEPGGAPRDSGVLERDPHLDLRRLALWVVVGSLPAGLVGVGLGDRLEAASADLGFLGITWALNALILTAAHMISRRGLPGRRLGQLGTAGALLIGLAQAFAVLRGISRSGSTIVAGLVVGLAPADAALFSFLLALPAIGGAALLKLPELFGGSVAVDPLALLGAFVLAFAVGVLALRLLLATTRRGLWWPYALWCAGLSATCFVLR